MFALINTRWFFADQDYILAIHPSKMQPILYLRGKKQDMNKIQKILKACRMELISDEIVNENGDRYYKLKEAKKDGKEEGG